MYGRVEYFVTKNVLAPMPILGNATWSFISKHDTVTSTNKKCYIWVIWTFLVFSWSWFGVCFLFWLKFADKTKHLKFAEIEPVYEHILLILFHIVRSHFIVQSCVHCIKSLSFFFLRPSLLSPPPSFSLHFWIVLFAVSWCHHWAHCLILMFDTEGKAMNAMDDMTIALHWLEHNDAVSLPWTTRSTKPELWTLSWRFIKLECHYKSQL